MVAPQSLRLHPRILVAFGEVATVLDVLSSRVPKCSVNLLDDLLSPLNARRDQLVSPWASLGSAEQIISGLHVQTGENRCHDADHSFPAFIMACNGTPFALYSPQDCIYFCPSDVLVDW
jgi:hypothetical protein